MTRLITAVAAATLAICASDRAEAQFDRMATPAALHSVHETVDGLIVAADETGTYVYDDWDAYFRSGFFFRHGKRCGSEALAHPQMGFLGTQSDCTSTSNNPAPEYDPAGAGAAEYDIPVVFHIFYANNGNGNIDDQRAIEQIQILNDDFASLTNSKIRFHLATEDPNGNPTNGINRYRNNRWYNDGGNYATQVGWDTNRYLNIYSNTAGGNLGYAYLPNGGGVVGSSFDGVRLFWRAVGYTNYAPYNLGRTGTHEVGHYLGLYHTFQNGCGTSNCNASGDLICDTNPESSPNYSACSPSERITCGNQDPVRNYMDYSEDACMDNFTMEQSMRMRCTIENWRVDLTTWEGGGGPGTPPDQATGNSPASGATGVATSATLSWDAAAGATQYDVYFGTSSNPGLVSANQSGTSYDPGTLATGTTYFWRVDTENGDGVTTGAIWSFTTEAGGGSGGGGDLPFTDGFESSSLAGWTTSGNVRVGTTAASGVYAAEIRRSGSLSRTLDTGGATSVTVDWSWRSNGLDYPSDAASLTIQHAGGSVTVDLSANGGYAGGSRTISGLSGSTVTLTFTCAANRNNERLYIDDISVQ